MTPRKSTKQTAVNAATPTPEAVAETLKQVEKSAKAGGNIFDKATLLVLRFEGVGNSRKVRTSQLDAQAKFDEDVVRANKKLFNCDEYKAIKRSEAELRQYLQKRALPSYFQEGSYLVKNEIIPKVIARLEETKSDRVNMLIPAFLNRYDEIVQEQMKLQGDLANPTDYESRDVVRSKYAMDWHWVRFSVAGSLEGISAELYEAEKQKARATWTAAANEMTLMMRESMRDLVDHMIDRLSSDENGKPKIFKNTLVSNMTEFLDAFEDRNVVDDEELKKLVDTARALMDGVDADELRDSKRTRKQVSEGFAQIKKTLDEMIEERPERAFSFDNI